MGMHPVYLVQRCTAKETLNPAGRFSESISLQYMGAAEYEFGVIPASLRRIANRADTFAWHTFPALADLAGRPLRVFTAFTGADLEDYVGHLTELREGRGRTKMGSRFSRDHELEQRTRAEENRQSRRKHKPHVLDATDLWWDPSNDVMWTYREDIALALPPMLAASLCSMNAQAKPAAPEQPHA